MRALVSVTLTSLVATSASAADVTMSIEIPRLNVAEYHRPYVAIWLEKADQSFVGNLTVWYDYKLKDGEGTKWLKDLRQWWRRSGRELEMPVDGLTGATRAPGTHQVTFPLDKAPLSGLAAGDYQLVVEAAREVGGREILRIPFQWPPKAPATLNAPGKDELGAVTLSLNP